MNCITFMVSWLEEHGYTFKDADDAYVSLICCKVGVGNPEDQTDSFSDETYAAWAAKLKSKEDWSVEPIDLRMAREAWIATQKEPRMAISRMIEYMWADERRSAEMHMAETGSLEGHIFCDLVAADNWLKGTHCRPTDYIELDYVEE
jgi:hypothetical protein